VVERLERSDHPAQEQIGERRVPSERRPVQIGPDDLALLHTLDAAGPVAGTDDHAAERGCVGSELGDTAVVLESRERRQVERRWFDDELADLATPQRTGAAVEQTEPTLCRP